MNPVSRGFRNTFRNGIRAFSIVVILAVIIGLALTMLIARGAVNDKIANVKSSIGTTITVSPAGQRGFGGGDGVTPLTSADVMKIQQTPHVASTVSTLTARVASTDTNVTSALNSRRSSSSSSAAAGRGFGGGSFMPSVNVTGTTNAASLSEIGAVSLASGSMIDASGSAADALIGQALATQNNLSVGSTFLLYGKTMTVKGIITTANDRFAGNSLIIPLATLQTVSGQGDTISAVTVTVDSIDNEASVVSALQSSLGSTADVVSAQTSAARALAPLESIANLSIFVLIASVAVGAVVILLIMVMIVRERRREIGVMKAIGASNTTVSLQFMVEAATMTLLASVIGIGLSIVAAGPITNVLVTNAASTTAMGGRSAGGMGGGFRQAFGNVASNLRNVTTHLDWTIILWGLGAAIIIALIGSFVASLWVSRVKPAEAVRAE